MKIVLVGEAWGRREAEFQHALVGPSGRELTLEMGIANLAPYMTLLCRKCKRETAYVGARCEHCQEHVWPTEFSLMDHWKRLRQDHEIAVTNVFNVKPPDFCIDCGTLDKISFMGRLPFCTVCKSKNVRTNELGYFFGTAQETEMTAWKASRTYGGSHLKAEFFHHVKRLWKEIEDLRPNLVVLMGNIPCWALLDQAKITALRGTVTWSERVNAKALPTFHPAAVLRQMPMRVSCIADYQKAAREAKFPEIRRPERWITIPAPNWDGIEEIRAWTAKYKISHATDIETLRGQISFCGFASERDQALVIPFRDGKSDKGRLVDVGKVARFIGFGPGDINFWPTEELEYAAWKLTIHTVESNSEKIFQNGIYDMSYFIRMGIHPRNAKHDTMLRHHADYIELPKSLGYMGSIYLDEISWKLMGRHDSLKRDE